MFDSQVHAFEGGLSQFREDCEAEMARLVRKYVPDAVSVTIQRDYDEDMNPHLTFEKVTVRSGDVIEANDLDDELHDEAFDVLDYMATYDSCEGNIEITQPEP